MNKKLTTRIGLGLASCLALVLSFSPLASALTASETYKSVDAALAYIELQQATDGSIASWDDSGEWSALAFVAAGTKLDEVDKGGTSLLQYFIDTKDLNTASYKYAYSLEQRILALNAAGYDVTNFEGIDYVDILAELIDDGSIYASDSTYDDIFALITAYATQDDRLLMYAQDLADDVVGFQQIDNGFLSSLSWEGTDLDSTSFAYSALYLASSNGVNTTSNDIDVHIANAYEYIDSKRTADDMYDPYGYGASLTSTAIVGLAFSISGIDATAINAALIDNQSDDGGFGSSWDGSADIYTPAYATLSLLQTNWLLNPAPMARPAVVTEPTKPEVITSEYQTKDSSSQTSSVAKSETSLSQASTETVVQETASTDDESTQDQAQEKEVITEAKSSNNFLKFLGYGLIFVAALGLVIYVVLGSGKKPKA